jgi:lipoyltransferase/lipoate-protein ligase
MIRSGFVVETDETNPYKNIALEALLLEQVPAETCVLYLWQNRHTVVIGRNQNAWKECRVEQLEAGSGFLARRLSGGGAVFHDMGNLNFTFLLPKADYSLERQTDVILRAVRKAGIFAQKTGRNDIETDGRKFSGNAFYQSGNNAYHHGTLLVSASMDDAAKYLSVSGDKIKAKGIPSVKSRMINLVEAAPSLTIGKLKLLLREAFDEVYGVKSAALHWDREAVLSRSDSAAVKSAAAPVSAPAVADASVRTAAGAPTSERASADAATSERALADAASLFQPGSSQRLAELEGHFSSPEWKYGKNPRFQFENQARFSWGGVEIRFDAERNIITNAEVFSDAMDEAFILGVAARVKGAAFTRQAVSAALEPLADTPERQGYCQDVTALMFA